MYNSVKSLCTGNRDCKGEPQCYMPAIATIFSFQVEEGYSPLNPFILFSPSLAFLLGSNPVIVPNLEMEGGNKIC